MKSYQIHELESRVLFSGVGDAFVPSADPRLSMDLTTDWHFDLNNIAGSETTAFDDSAWQDINLPHTWNAQDGQDGGNNYYRGVGWYRKSITIPDSYAGKQLYIQFDGSSVITDLYIDGTPVGTHAGSFAGFDFDVTPYLQSEGPHLFAVRVDNTAAATLNMPPQAGGWNSNGGIYRSVHLLAVDPLHLTMSDLDSSGVYFTSPVVATDAAQIAVKSIVDNSSITQRDYELSTILVDHDGMIVSQTDELLSAAAQSSATISDNSTVANPHLWNGRLDPYLHDLYVELRDPVTGELIDRVHQQVGIRSYQLDPAGGFMLNGQPYDLHGVNLHQDRLNKAWAISDQDIEQDVSLILEVGATMIRTAHYQHSQHLYDLADQTGLVIWTEIPVNSSLGYGVTPNSPAFNASAQQQLSELIRQNFNHPSIIVWGLYNEVNDDAINRNLATSLNALAHQEDPTRLTTGASWNATIGSLEHITDSIAFNKYYGWYYGAPSALSAWLDAAHAVSPSTPMGVSEYGAGGSVNQHSTSLTPPATAGTWHPEEYQNYIHEQTWPQLRARSYLWCKLLWVMFDFSLDDRNEGDKPGFNDKGLITADRQTKKDSFFYYKANWSTDPVLYITSRTWTQRTEGTTDIKVYSNVENPQLTVNGVLLGAMNSLGNGVYVIPQIAFAAGTNVVSVTGILNGQTYSDNVTWTYTPPPPTIAGVAFSDANQNGQLDAGETRLAGATIFLDGNSNNLLDSGESSVITDATGAYKFTGLAEGQYHLRIVLASGIVLTTPTADPTVVLGQNLTGVLFGTYKPKCTISGVIFGDANANGIYDTGDSIGAARTVFLDLNGNNLLDTSERAIQSNASGVYTFTNLDAGTYHVRRVFPSGYTYSTAIVDVTLIPGQVLTGANIGSKSGTVNPPPPPPPPPPTGKSISGMLFFDNNKNGKKDTADLGQSGKTVYIDRNGNNILDANESRTTTDAKGNFTFTNLAAGTYLIRRVVPTGYYVTTPQVSVNLSTMNIFGILIGTALK